MAAKRNKVDAPPPHRITFLEGRRYAATLEPTRLALLIGLSAAWQSSLGRAATATLLGYSAASGPALLWLVVVRPRPARQEKAAGVAQPR